MHINNVVGYVLLAIGVIIITFSLFVSYSIFTEKSSPPLLFRTPLELNQEQNSDTSDFQQQLGQELSNQINKAIPLDAFPKLLNLLSWSFLASLLILGGGQIAGLGIKLIK